MCTGLSRPASMPASTASSPISIFYDIDTPLKQFVCSHGNLIRHCTDIHAAIAA
jgi:hypothetical protein